MNRRSFLSTVGLGSLGLFTLRERTKGPPRITVWASERAARYDALPARAVSYLSAALEDAIDGVDVRYGGSVAVPTERAYELVVGGDWPATLAEETVGGRARLGDVNVLVTDGDMSNAPTGIGVPQVAAVGGARHIARMPPADEAASVLPFTYRSFATQVVLHECGHALGLRHGDGAVFESDGAAVVTPMVSAYAWASEEVRAEHFHAKHGACGATAAPADGQERRLKMRFSSCAQNRLRENGILVRG